MLVPQAWEEWTEAALGVWLAVSPSVLAFSAQTSAMYVALGTGIVVTALALWTLATDKGYGGWLHDRSAH